MATEWGLTGWDEDESRRAAGSALLNWIGNRGGASSKADDETAIRQVRRLIEAHGGSRFESATLRVNTHTSDEVHEKIYNRLGYRESGADGQYWVLPEAFKQELCNGFDYRAVCRALDDKGYLDRQKPSWMHKVRVHDHKSTIWVFAIRASILESET